MSDLNPIRVLVWGENRHEQFEEHVAAIYPNGMHGTIAEAVREHANTKVDVHTATLDEPDHGLTEEVLAGTDVLTWWGHKAHGEVKDDVVERIQRHVLAGMGLIVLHSGHFSKIFKALMGTTCSLQWRNDAERELVWTVAPGHPIAAGVPHPIVIDQQEMYGEHFDVPVPDETVFLSSFAGGEVFRSGLVYRRGHGRIFYFSPGDQEYPVYHHPDVRRVIANAVSWARPTGQRSVPALANVPEQREWRAPVGSTEAAR